MSGEVVDSDAWEDSCSAYNVAENPDLVACMNGLAPFVVVDAEMQFVCYCATEENAKAVALAVDTYIRAVSFGVVGS